MRRRRIASRSSVSLLRGRYIVRSFGKRAAFWQDEPEQWASIRSAHPTSGWSGRGGLTLNPYALDRNPSGSSAGSGVAASANLCAAAIGTETDGSIISPAATNGLVGLKPTVGLLSRFGIIPISHSQDTPGPMARTVADAAALLSVLKGIDSRDAATNGSRGKAIADYTTFLKVDGLRGARIKCRQILWPERGRGQSTGQRH